MRQFKALNVWHQRAFIVACVGILCSVASFLFILLPTYQVVGDSLNENFDTEKADKKLHTLERNANYLNAGVVICAVTSLGLGLYGFTQNAKKSKRKS
jgi:hypothetical protein